MQTNRQGAGNRPTTEAAEDQEGGRYEAYQH